MEMALAKVPIVPQWNLNSGCICTPDGGFLYVGSRTINYIGSVKNVSSPPLMKVFHTRQPILSIDLDPAWSNEEGAHKYFAALAQDLSVQIWDFDKGCAVFGHKAHFATPRHMEGNGPSPQLSDRVLISYMRTRNVLSVDSLDFVVFCMASNTYVRRPLFPVARNQQLTVLRASPYNEHVFALGTSRGLVLVCDLQQMRVLYTLKGHDAAITTLSWMRVSSNELPQQVVQEHKQKQSQPKKVANVAPAGGGDDIFDIYDYDYLENEFGAPTNASKNKSEPASDFVGIEKPKEATTLTKFDFAEACQSLKEEIDALKPDMEAPPQCDEVTLADCQQVERQDDLSSSCGDDNEDGNESTEGSLEVLGHSSSDDGVDVDGVERKPKQQILHKAEVHAAQTLERTTKPTEEKELAAHDSIGAVGKPNEAASVKNSPQVLKTPVGFSGAQADTLLASAAIDGSFWIWNADTGASCDSLKSRGSNANQQRKNIHIEISWLSPTTFLTTNKQGDLCCWSMQPVDAKESNPRYKFKEEKRRFMQRAVVSFSNCNKNQLLWSISSYREISCEDLKSGKLLAKYCCASTNISAMRECPDDMNKIALGFSDRRIGIIDISKMSPTNVHIENFTLRVDSAVLSIVWSPDNKKFAYGTIEGRIAIVNVEVPKYQPFTFNPLCGKPIYSMDWQGSSIYVVCNDSVAVYNDNMNSKDACVIPGIKNVSSISVRGNYLFAGTQHGHLQVFCRKPQSQNLCYELVHDLEMAPRYITEIAWSPIASDQLAVVANAKNIHILKFNFEDGKISQTHKIEIKSPKAANACVKWSNHTANELLTCGFDGAIRVWDINCKTNEEKFLKQYHCPMTCGLFLPTDEQVVLCAGKSTSVEMFDMRLEKSENYSVSKWKRSNAHTLDHVQWAMKVLSGREGNKMPTTTEKRRQRRAGENVENIERNAESSANGHNDSNTEITKMINDLKIDEKKEQEESSEIVQGSTYMKSPATLLYLTTKELNKDALEILNLVLTSVDKKQQRGGFMCPKLFGTKAQAKELMVDEMNNHRHSERGISNIFMPQVNSNIKEEILKCVQTKQLTEWHVSLAPTISYNFWQKCSTAFAEQLIEQGYALQAATYMLAVHNQVEAIQMLLEKNYFKEALLIARVYLQPDDPLIVSIADKWITYLDTTGNLPAAALLCYLSGQKNRSYETLSKVRNSNPDIERILQLLKTTEKAHGH